MSSILNITERPIYDESITKKEYHTYQPYLKTFQNNDEIRITIQNQDLYVLPSESLLYIEGTVKQKKLEQNKEVLVVPDDKFFFKNNMVAHLFHEIRYELNGIEIDRTRYLGQATTIKNLVSLNQNESGMMENSGWSLSRTLRDKGAVFNFCVPLKYLLGFAEDFGKIIINSKHELILLRAKSDARATPLTHNSCEMDFKITNVSWKVPHVHLSDAAKLQTLKIVKSGQPLPLVFRTWDCHFYPELPQGQEHSWNVKLAPQNERPRFILIAFEKSEKFIDCSLSDLKVHLNSESYPYDDMNLNLDRNRYAILYDMYVKFQESYYMRDPKPLLSRTDFLKFPVFVIDVTHQNEQVKSGPIDIRIQFKTNVITEANTSAYCLLIHDRVLTYTPLTGEIVKH